MFELKPTMAPEPLEVKNLSFRYRDNGAAIEELSFRLQAGGLLLVAGASGCGKTTLMPLHQRTDPAHLQGGPGGEICLPGRARPAGPWHTYRRQVGNGVTRPRTTNPWHTGAQRGGFGLENLNLQRAAILQRVGEALAYLGISPPARARNFHLSGGEKQKVALAGVLAMRPGILLLDEPLASLDPASAHETLRPCAAWWTRACPS